MREVDEHAESVHLTHDAVAECCEAIVFRRIERRVGPVERDVVCQRHVANAEVVVRAQSAERILDGVPTLESEE